MSLPGLHNFFFILYNKSSNNLDQLYVNLVICEVVQISGVINPICRYGS